MQKRNNIGAIILAAGSSRRLGRPKQLLEIDGEPLVRRTARLALEAGYLPVVVVLGGQREAVGATLEGLGVQMTLNPNWSTGMGSSVRAGLAALPAKVEGVLFLLTDQPLVDLPLLKNLSKAFRKGEAPLVASDYGHTLGVPAIFHRQLFGELKKLTGDQGARRIIQRFEAELVSVHFPGGKLDIDTEEDWERFRNEEA